MHGAFMMYDDLIQATTGNQPAIVAPAVAAGAHYTIAPSPIIQLSPEALAALREID
jgi:hypothetical protein